MSAVIFLSAALTVLLVPFSMADHVATSHTGAEQVRLGEELFNREWVANDARSPSGDGLGPVYNETSCVACHNLAAPGGAGPATKNITILTRVGERTISTSPVTSPEVIDPVVSPETEKSPLFAPMLAFVRGENARLTKQSGERKSAPPSSTQPAAGSVPKDAQPPTDTKEVNHPELEVSTSVTLHRFGTDSAYEQWRANLLGFRGFPAPARISDEKTGVQRFGPDPAAVAIALDLEVTARILPNRRLIRIGSLVVLPSERNTTPLFGAGLIDAIPDRVIEAEAAQQDGSKQVTEIHGRVSRLPDGRIGRFGWKGQMASLKDFVLTACAVELGLEVPGHHQSPDPLSDKRAKPGLDLSAPECDALTAFVASLPAPVQRAPAGKDEKRRMDAGRDLFTSIGCASCHRPNMGDVEGLYSDLLLHDMGPSLGDTGSYSGSRFFDSRDERPIAAKNKQPDTRQRIVAATRQEWRTPPLWGIRDSGPYLHDGRATTLEHAIAIHGGEAKVSAEEFAALDPSERALVMTFLKSLVAPTVQLAQHDGR
jgi:CxxC motif-containing protein (DUF1111 family)